MFSREITLLRIASPWHGQARYSNGPTGLITTQRSLEPQDEPARPRILVQVKLSMQKGRVPSQENRKSIAQHALMSKPVRYARTALSSGIAELLTQGVSEMRETCVPPNRLDEQEPMLISLRTACHRLVLIWTTLRGSLSWSGPQGSG